MKGADLIIALKKKLGLKTDTALRRAIGVSGMTLHNWRNRKITPRIIADHVAYGRASGEKVVSALRKKFKASTIKVLAKKLGVTQQAIHYWKDSSALTVRQIAGMVATAAKASSETSYQNAIRPLVEFFPISKCESKGGAKWELFSTRSVQKGLHAYLSGLRDELSAHHGVYVFFDSRGQAIYTGKARKQSLWSEITHAFNRDRGSIQMIRRVRHPSRNQPYRTSDEKARQIREQEVPLYELAVYFSAYEVADPLVEDVESLLVRSFANDVLNKRMERFGRHRATNIGKRSKRRRNRRGRIRRRG